MAAAKEKGPKKPKKIPTYAAGLGRRVASLIESRGLIQKQVESATKISQSNLSLLLKGGQGISVEKLVRLAVLLEASLDFLLSEAITAERAAMSGRIATIGSPHGADADEVAEQRRKAAADDRMPASREFVAGVSGGMDAREEFEHWFESRFVPITRGEVRALATAKHQRADTAKPGFWDAQLEILRRPATKPYSDPD